MKKKNRNIILFLIVISFILGSCNGFEDLQDDPNYPSAGMPNLLLPYLVQDVFYGGNPTNWAAASQQLFYTERRESPQYWGWRADGFGWYDSIRQAMKMEEEAAKSGSDAYIPIAQFFQQIAFYEQTRSVGDIPYSEAMQAKSGNITPKYDLQKDVFIGILKKLEEINNDFNDLPPNASISGDILYKGDLSKWQKLVNSYRLKILMDLSMKESDSNLDITGQFSKMIGNKTKYPIFESNDDMPRFKFYDQDNNKYPTYNQTTTRIQQKLVTTLVDYMVETKDPRIFRFAEPAWPEESSSWSDAQKNDFRTQYSSYKGLDPDLIHGDGAKQISSNIHWRYYENPTVEDYVKYTYSEFNFIMAEAVLRNWIAGNAQEYLDKGIDASMQFFNAPKGDYSFTLSADSKTAIEQVNMQKYVAMFMNSSWEAWYNHRRMSAHKLGPEADGVPHFKAGPSHYVASPPLRWEYPQSEIFNNETNVKEALNRQFGGVNDIFGIMWMIK